MRNYAIKHKFLASKGGTRCGTDAKSSKSSRQHWSKRNNVHQSFGRNPQKICKCRDVIVASVKKATPGGVVKRVK